MERELGESAEINWSDLKGDIQNKWAKLKGKLPKPKFFQKYAVRLLQASDAPDMNVVERAPEMKAEPVPGPESAPAAVNVELGLEAKYDGDTVESAPYIEEHKLEDASSIETWKYLAQNWKECSTKTLARNMAKVGGPIAGSLMSVGVLMSSWLLSKKSNKVHMMGSSKADQESSFMYKVSPFVEYVITAIIENEHIHSEKLDIKTLYEAISYDASNKVLDCQTTLNGLGSTPVCHYTPN